MAWAMACPCAGPRSRVRRTSMSSVPWRSSMRSFSSVDILAKNIAAHLECQGERCWVGQTTKRRGSVQQQVVAVCRRGEVLALRWGDIRNDAAFVDRSLCQTRDGLTFKSTKTEKPRRIELPPTIMPVLARHRERQNEFRRQFGADYRSDLDLIIANPDGTPLKPDSVSGTVSRLCRMLGLP